MIKLILIALTDIIFFAVLILTAVFLLSDMAGWIHLSREIGQLVVRLFIAGAPLSLVFSLIAFFNFKKARHKRYCLISVIEVLILVMVYWIIYASQI
ncbi:hypothetical protein A6R74_07390 [Halomonas sp. ALS9]|nr:hypothetical protein A6R74_07390 [Halomonas sp. ALS9]